MKKRKTETVQLLISFFKFLFPKEDRTILISDFELLYENVASEKGKLYGLCWIFLQIIRSLPGLVSANLYWRHTMIKNYLKIAIRNMTKHKSYSVINIFGLAIGIAACIFIFQYVSFEKSYDRFHENAENIYRVRYDAYQNDKLQFKSAATVPAIGPAMKREFAEVTEFTRVSINWGGVTVSSKSSLSDRNIIFREKKVHYADPSFFTVFSFPFISGISETALTEPSSVVFSETIARKYFGNDSLVGRTVVINDKEFKVTGVYKDVPGNSHIKFNIIISNHHLRHLNDWHWDDFYTYVLLKKNCNPDLLESKLPHLISRYTKKSKCKYFLQRLTDIHLHSRLQVEAEINGNSTVVHFLLSIAILILIIAWVNYINLTTVRSTDRAKETGLRKISGATQAQLIRQFLFESIFTNCISAVLALLFVVTLSAFFENYTGNIFSFKFLINTWFGLLLMLFLIIGSLFTGLYPAVLASSFNLSTVLKGKLNNTNNGLFLRKGFVIFQFAVSISLIIGTIFAHKQLSFMRDHELGIDIKNTLVLRGPQSADSLYKEKFSSFKSELLRNPEIINVAASLHVPGVEIDWTRGIKKLTDDPDEYMRIFNLGVDYDFINAYKLKLLAGRFFSKEFGSENFSVVLNRAGVELLGYQNPQDALNQLITFGSPRPRVVIGVVENYHHLSLRSVPEPFIFHFFPNARTFYSLKLGTQNSTEVINKLTKIWNEFFPESPLDYFFLDDFFDKQYLQDKHLEQTFAVFAFLAILIACLGLFGLSSFSIMQKTKEIGIRKILGANTVSILILFSKEFVRLIIISAIITIPLSWFGLMAWLQNYPFRVNIEFQFLILPVILTLFIAIFTISFQIIKVARANPVEALRYE